MSSLFGIRADAKLDDVRRQAFSGQTTPWTACGAEILDAVEIDRSANIDSLGRRRVTANPICVWRLESVCDYFYEDTHATALRP